MRPIRTGLLNNLRGNLFGGITAGIVALPLALAFGVASGLGAAAGLYGAIALGLMAALFGGTPTQVSGPTGPMTVVMAGLVLALKDPGLAFSAVLLAGLIQVAFGVLRWGAYIQYVPYPVISGFMSGIGVIIIILQLLPMMGLEANSSIVASLSALPEAVQQLNGAALALGLGAIFVIYGMPYLSKAVPTTLVALIALTLLSVVLRLDIPRIGVIPHGLPALHWPTLEPRLLWTLLVPAITLAALGSIDSLLTSLVADKLTRTRHDSNRELIGQGIGNALAGLVGGLPGAGATMRTVVNINAGGTGRLSGVVHAGVLMAVIFGLGALAAQIPLAVLAGILVTVGVGIIDTKGLRHFWRVPRGDATVMVTVFGLTVFVDLIQAVAVGMVMACLIFVKRASDRALAIPLRAQDHQAGSLEDLNVPTEVSAGIFVLPIQGEIFFGNSSRLQGQLAELQGARAVVIDCGLMPYLDQSGAYALSDFILDLRALGMRVYLSDLQPQPSYLLAMAGIAPGEVPADAILPSVLAGMNAEADLMLAERG